MTITEYLYVDHRRLDSYFEQISSPVKYDKIPTWKVVFGLTTPKVEATQSKLPRSFNDHEKVSELIRNLQRNSQIAYSGMSLDKFFVLESLRAHRVFIPADMQPSGDFPGIAIWLCLDLKPDDRSNGYRYLIEDFQHDDATPTQTPSGWSAFYQLFAHLSEELKRAKGFSIRDIVDTSTLRFTVQWRQVDELENAETSERKRILQALLQSEGLAVPNLIVRDEYVSHRNHRYDISCNSQRYIIRIIDESESLEMDLRNFLFGGMEPSIQTPEGEVMLNRLRRIRDRANPNIAVMRVLRNKNREFGYRFAANPIEVLREWGAHVGSTRTIDVLYRIREKVHDSSYEPDALIGYPIVIAEHPSPLVS